ncbi:MAG TPA: hypothetical protein VM598_14625 [Bdellovibrionota bacterium]|nr:hypothetical protein [Bdellovibrionota bacterium]
MTRAIDWFDHAISSVSRHERELGDSAPYIVERLTTVLLERLPSDLSNRMLRMLPREVALSHEALHRPADSAGDRTIGYVAFVAAAHDAIGVCEGKLAEHARSDDGDAFCRKIVDAFLWAVAQELPADMKAAFVGSLPGELRSRMNIYSDVAEGSQVA